MAIIEVENSVRVLFGDVETWLDESRELHRLDGPARIWKNGREEWFIHGTRHRLNGPAIIWEDGDQWWFKNGQRHRDDGPARLWNNKQEWWLNGALHRLDGPAITYSNGQEEWWVTNENITADVRKWIVENDLSNWKSWSISDATLFTLRFR